MNNGVISYRERAYLSWLNSKFSALRPPLLLLSLDDERFRDGSVLAELFRVLSGQRLLIKVPCITRSDRISNVALLLRHLRYCEVPVRSIREEDVVDGDKATILRLLLHMSSSFGPRHNYSTQHGRSLNSIQQLPCQSTPPCPIDVGPIATVSSSSRRIVPRQYQINVSSSPLSPYSLPSTKDLPYRQNEQWFCPRRGSSLACNSSFSSEHQHNEQMSDSSASDTRFCENGNHGAARPYSASHQQYPHISQPGDSKELSWKSKSPLSKRFVSTLFISSLSKDNSTIEIDPNRLLNQGAVGRLPSSLSLERVSSRSPSLPPNGYVNHGFVDPAYQPSVSLSTPKLEQLAAFQNDLAGVRLDLLRLKDMLTENNSSPPNSVDSVQSPDDVFMDDFHQYPSISRLSSGVKNLEVENSYLHRLHLPPNN